MNTNTVIGLIALVIVIGAGVWLYSAQDKSALTSGEGAKTEAEGSGTYAELIGRAGSWKCDITVAVAEAPSEGTVYIADGKIRADFVARPAALNGGSVSAHMIQADSYVYTWSDMAPQGIKLMIKTDEQGKPIPGAPANDQRVEYSCSPWSVDVSQFTPPSTIEFMEFNGQPGMPLPM